MVFPLVLLESNYVLLDSEMVSNKKQMTTEREVSVICGMNITWLWSMVSSRTRGNTMITRTHVWPTRSCNPAFSPKLRFKFRYGGKTEKNVKFRFSLKTWKMAFRFAPFHAIHPSFIYLYSYTVRTAKILLTITFSLFHNVQMLMIIMNTLNTSEK